MNEKGKRPSDASKEMLSVFGQREMEIASKIIVDRAKKNSNNWLLVLEDDMFSGDELAKEGFRELKRLGWVIYSNAINGWRVTDRFIERVTSDDAKKHDK